MKKFILSAIVATFALTSATVTAGETVSSSKQASETRTMKITQMHRGAQGSHKRLYTRHVKPTFSFTNQQAKNFLCEVVTLGFYDSEKSNKAESSVPKSTKRLHITKHNRGAQGSHRAIGHKGYYSK